MGHEYFWGGGMWIFPIIMLIIVLIIVFGRGRMMPPWHDNNRLFNRENFPNNALEILKQRYAKGEISKEEFEQIKKDIV